MQFVIQFCLVYLIIFNTGKSFRGKCSYANQQNLLCTQCAVLKCSYLKFAGCENCQEQPQQPFLAIRRHRNSQDNQVFICHKFVPTYQQQGQFIENISLLAGYGERHVTASQDSQDVFMPGTWITIAGCTTPIIHVNCPWF